MKLLLDIGNTRVKWGRASGSKLVASGSFQHQRQSISSARLDAAAGDPTEVREVWTASVAAAPLVATIAAWASARLGSTLRIATVQPAAFGVVCGYRDYQQLGVDRWLALIGARALTSGPVCVVDAGTATTIDALDSGGRHLGGVILPGLRLMRRALATGTGQLPDVASGSAPVFAAGTTDAILSGTLQAACGAVERLVRAATERCQAMPELLMTGGDAALLAASIGVPARRDPLLVLKGLAIVAAAR